ncbi:protease SohB [Coxiella endosymbiont of Amblyomma nuttalli]|uniref:protease SohB n=1 Tax=Coxiella endosymbiont of Amblyomma nuttalli TaxID=2749996 RepID=UPI001BA89CD1|nr:protease SohB [Coxiella endosymbiont of Amblyomma nuttalli]QTS84028.1 putative protease SohB [Coxiella endosymbiont of Amblyomma nuttalli]
MEFLISYGLFLIKLLSVVITILVIFFAFFGFMIHAKGKFKGKLDIYKLNDKYEAYYRTLSQAIKKKNGPRLQLKQQKREKKAQLESKKPKKRIFVLNFHGDVRASNVVALCEEITALLTVARKKDEVLVRLESSGGMVHSYGLAASQLQRIKEANIRLVVAVDKIAASGGYLMACVADHIIAAPFAAIGSIGVLARLPNFHRFLQKKSIDFEQITAGEYKRTLTLFGENTDKDREKVRQEVEEIHALFKTFIKQHRKVVDIDRVATGECWLASQAIHLKLVDELKTSDDYLLTASQQYVLFEMQYKLKRPLGKRLSQSVGQIYDRLVNTSELFR